MPYHDPADPTRALVAHAAVVRAAARVLQACGGLEPAAVDELAAVIARRTAIIADLLARRGAGSR